jgi:hypothetical protein
MQDRKRELKTAYKERSIDAGIFYISFSSDAADTTGGQQFLLPARDFKSTENRLRFTLEMGNCTYKELQTAYNELGDAALRFEIAESYEPEGEISPDALADDLRELLHLVSAEHPEATVIEPARI